MDLEVKMAGMTHNLSAITSIADVNPDAHQLVDLVMGHNNLYVSIFESGQTQTPLLSIGSKAVNLEVHKFKPTEQVKQHEWRDSTVARYLALRE